MRLTSRLHRSRCVQSVSYLSAKFIFGFGSFVIDILVIVQGLVATCISLLGRNGAAAFEILRQQDQSTSAGLLNESTLAVIKQFRSSPYWDRLWTVQEIDLFSEVSIMCGHEQLPPYGAIFGIPSAPTKQGGGFLTGSRIT